MDESGIAALVERFADLPDVRVAHDLLRSIALNVFRADKSRTLSLPKKRKAAA